MLTSGQLLGQVPGHRRGDIKHYLSLMELEKGEQGRLSETGYLIRALLGNKVLPWWGKVDRTGWVKEEREESVQEQKCPLLPLCCSIGDLEGPEAEAQAGAR